MYVQLDMKCILVGQTEIHTSIYALCHILITEAKRVDRCSRQLLEAIDQIFDGLVVVFSVEGVA